VSGANAGMTITDIKAYPTWQGARNIMLVKVECEHGLFGWGEAGLSGRELAVAGAVDHYKQFLIGQDGMRIGALWQEMCKSGPG
jgi:galactonate dehydratase